MRQDTQPPAPHVGQRLVRGESLGAALAASGTPRRFWYAELLRAFPHDRRRSNPGQGPIPQRGPEERSR